MEENFGIENPLEKAEEEIKELEEKETTDLMNLLINSNIVVPSIHREITN